MRKIIKLVGKYNDLELGYEEEGTYYMTGLLEDHDHSWKILEWINQNLNDGHKIEVMRVAEDMMEDSKRKNKEALMKIVDWAFRNIK